MPNLNKDTYTKPEVEALVREVEETFSDQMNALKRQATMTDAERAVYASLSGDVQSSFLFATSEERAEVVNKRAESNPVVYTAKNGDVFRKSDDPRLVQMAKDRDVERADFLKMMQERENDRMKKRAETELANLPGDVDTRAAILKAVETSIEDETVRAAAIDALKAHNARLGASFREVGASGAGHRQDGSAKAYDELDALAKKMAADNPDLDYYSAFAKVSEANPALAARAIKEG